MRNIWLLLFLFLSFLSFGEGSEVFNYVGEWGVNDGDYESTRGGFFLSISKIDNSNRYFVISVNKKLPFFTFIAGGYVRDDGYLQIKTDDGIDWLITPAHSTKHDDAISITNLERVESFGWFIRVEEKFRKWPFEILNEKK